MYRRFSQSDLQLYVCGGIPEILANAIVKLPFAVPYWLSKIYRRKQRPEV